MPTLAPQSRRVVSTPASERGGWLAIGLLWLGLFGCAETTLNRARPVPGLGVAQPPALNAPDGPRTLAIVDGLRLSSDNVAAVALEAAGSVAIEEAALDALLDRELAALSIVLPADASQEELKLVLGALVSDGNVTSEQTGVVIERLRRQRGLGPARFDALLARNAKLRVLASPSVEFTPEDLKTALGVEFGPKVRARVLTVPTRELAADIRVRLSADTDDVLTTFSRLASQFSTDPSGPAGGVVEPMSPADLSLPPALRSAMQDPPLGLFPEAIDTGRGFTLFYVEQKLPAQADPSASEQARVEAKARRRLERLAMDRLARQLLERAKITVLDDSARWSWENRPR